MAEAVSAVAMADSARDAKQMRTVVWVMSLALVGLLFDGYDLVVYGACVSTFLRDPTQLGVVSPATAGQLGSYALFGVLVGALLAGSVGDILGRRKVMLFAYAWFSIGMAATALTSSVAAFGAMRFLTGLGVGALVATTAALVSEFAPKGKKNLCNAIVYSGIPAGSLMAAALAIVLMGVIGWRGLFMIGALPLVTLFPLAYFKMPESVVWLTARGRVAEARALAGRTGIDMPDVATEPGTALANPVEGKASWAGSVHLLPAGDLLARADERHRPDAGLFVEHLAPRTDVARRLQRPGLAVLPDGAQRRCGVGRSVGLQGRRPLRGEAGGRRVLRDWRSCHPAPDHRLPARARSWPPWRSLVSERAAPRR